MKGLKYKTFLHHNFFNHPIHQLSTVIPFSLSPFKTLIPDSSGIISDFTEYYDPESTFAPYGCTTENTTTPIGPFTYFNIALEGYLYTGDTGGDYTFVFYQLYNNDDVSYFYFGDNAQNPSTSNVDQITTYADPSNSFTAGDLEPQTYYPILMYYGQSFGGSCLTLGVITPYNTDIDYSPDCLVTDKPYKPPDSSKQQQQDTNPVKLHQNPLIRLKKKGQTRIYTT